MKELSNDEYDTSAQEYKSVIGHSRNTSIGLHENDTVRITINFTYETKTVEKTMDIVLKEENNHCEGNSGQTYGFDLVLNLEDYIENTSSTTPETPQTYEYTINYYYDGVKNDTQTVNGTAEEGKTVTSTNTTQTGYVIDANNTKSTSMVISSTENNVLNIYYVSESTSEPEPTVNNSSNEETVVVEKPKTNNNVANNPKTGQSSVTLGIILAALIFASIYFVSKSKNIMNI